MALPQIDVPVYTTQLPSTGEVVKFRPFLVREQKQLLIAQNAGIEQQTQAVLDIVNVCTYEKLPVDKLPAYDIEYLFLQLRTHSVGENIDLVLTCGECENKQETKLDLTTVKVEKSPEHEHNVDLGNGLILNMQDPNLAIINSLRSETELTADIVIAIIASCIRTIWKGDESYAAMDYTQAELIEFVENLSPGNLEQLEKYFVTMPRLKHVLDFTCNKCGKENSAAMEGLQSFFA